jgi:hypothetical protein
MKRDHDPSQLIITHKMVRLLAQVSTISEELANEYLTLYNQLEEQMKKFLIDDNSNTTPTPDVNDQQQFASITRTQAEEMMNNSEIGALQAIAKYFIFSHNF